jgi:hypothetical protein
VAEPIFIFGVARSGTNLIARMIDAHSRAAIVLDPLLPFFRSLRNATVRASGDERLHARFDPSSAMHDYYQNADGPRLLDLMLDTTLDLPIAADELPALRAAVLARVELEAGAGARRFDGLSGGTYGEFLRDLLARIDAPGYAGVKEVWTIEFIPALARAFPTARFVAIERDPRDVVLSLVKLAERDPTQAAHTVSYMRHWRKHAVLARHFQRDKALSRRVFLVGYETLVRMPEEGAGALCRFLDIDFEPAMMRLDRGWEGNSSFEADSARITTRPVGRWREQGDRRLSATVEFLCGPEMTLGGYPGGNSTIDSTEVLREFVAAGRAPGSWRSDSGDPIADFGFELFRHELLKSGPDTVDEATLRRCFLFPWAFEAICTASPAATERASL